MTKRQYRALFAALGLAGAAVVAAAFLFGSPDAGREPLLPRAVEGIDPAPGSQVPLQAPIEVDLPVGYRAEIFVDGFRAPDSEVRYVEGTGVHSWTPARSSVVAWGPGPHTVSVRWRKITTGLADEGEYSWSFRVF